MSEESALFLFDLRERVGSLARKDLPKIKDLKIIPALIEAIDFREVIEQGPKYIYAVSVVIDKFQETRDHRDRSSFPTIDNHSDFFRRGEDRDRS